MVTCLKYIKKVIMSSFIIYAFNVIAVNFNIVLPINVWTVLFISFFDVFGLAILLILKILGV